MHGWRAGPLTGIAMMKLLAGLEDERVDALLILFAAKMVICFQDWWRDSWQQSSPESSDARVITILAPENS